MRDPPSPAMWSERSNAALPRMKPVTANAEGAGVAGARASSPAAAAAAAKDVFIVSVPSATCRPRPTGTPGRRVVENKHFNRDRTCPHNLPFK
jgi:hypothetical protein